MKKTMHDYMRDVPEVAGNLLKDCKGLAAGFVENLKGKEPWEVMMIAKRRKTMVVCYECHKKIHNQSFEIEQ